MKDVIVTGGSGFIGKALTEKLRKQVLSVGKIIPLSSSDCDLVDKDSTMKWFEKIHWMHDVSHIFHLAAVYKAGGWPATHPATQYFSNMAININVLEAWKRFFPKARLTSSVSYCMYPDHEEPHAEEEFYGTEPEKYLFAYAFTKKALIVGQKAYREEFGLSSVAGVLPTIYGPGDSFKENSHVVGALIGKCMAAKANADPSFNVWGNGTQKREFLYVEDAAEGLLRIALSNLEGHINLGPGRAASVRELVDIIVSCCDYSGSVAYNENEFTGAKVRVMNTRRMKNDLKWQPQIRLFEGIRMTIDSLTRDHKSGQ